MSNHNSAVFNNSCLRVPRNPSNKQPVPIYEQSSYNDIANKVRELSLETNVSTIKIKSNKDYEGRDCFRAFIDFFDSIPNYEDVNHLSNREFYRKLEQLKERQRNYYDYFEYDTKCVDKNEEEHWNNTNNNNKSRRSNGKKLQSPKPKSSLKPFCSTPTINKNYKHDDESVVSSSDKEIINKPPSRRSVRIEESPTEKFPNEYDEYFRCKSRANISSASSKGKVSSCNEWDDLTVDDVKFDDSQRDTPLMTRSAPCSPNKSKQSVGWKDTITVPKPFQMTVKDEENKIIDEILIRNVKPKERKQEMFKANPVPIESKIPLFDKIMAEQEKRRETVKKKSKANLMAQMRPFSFTQREEELQNLSRNLSRSTPSLYYYDDRTTSQTEQFRAKPVPKNLFSNYVYKKMHEDEFYRALQKRIRAEEMLRASSLPPSMEKRERCKIQTAICANALTNVEQPRKKSRKKEQKTQNNQINEYMREYLCYTPKHFRKCKKKRIKSSSSTTSRNTESNRESSIDFDCMTRSNLAAVLRAQNTRKRIAFDMYKKLEEAKFKEELRWKEKMMRKKPIWDVLAYSHEEDLAMRLQMRRDEERMRNVEHKQRMYTMLGRVNRQPTLFERQSMVLNNDKYKKVTKDYYKDRGDIYSDKFSISDCSEKRYLMDGKDEAVQAADDLLTNDGEKFDYDDDEDREK